MTPDALYSSPFVAKRSWETHQPALLGELELVVPQIGPAAELRLLILWLVGVAVGGADTFELHEDLQERGEVLLGL